MIDLTCLVTPVHTSHSDVFTGGRTAEFERSCEATLCPGGAATLSVLDGKEHGGSCSQKKRIWCHTRTKLLERREEPTEIGEERATRLLRRREADRRRRAVETPCTAQVQVGVVFSFPSMIRLSTRVRDYSYSYSCTHLARTQWSTFPKLKTVGLARLQWWKFG